MSFQALGNSQVGNAVPGWAALGGWSLPPPTFPAPAGEIELLIKLPTRVAFGPSALGLGLALIYQLPSRVAFGASIVTEQTFIAVFLNGVDVSKYFLVNTVQVTDVLSQPTTASFSMWVPNESVTPQVGQQVTIYVKGQRIFGGYIDQPFQTSFQAVPGYGFLGTPGGTGGVSSATGSTASGGGGAVQCTDYSSLLSRRYVGLYFDGNGSPTPSFLSDIVQYIVSTYLAQDGFSYDDSDGDPAINLGPTLFNWVTIQAAFNTLSSSTGWDFKVDQFQVIRFAPAASGTGPAAFNLANNDGNVYAESLGVEYMRSTYRNRQGVASPSQQGQLWQDIYSVSDPGPFANYPQPPDGVRKTFLQLYGFTALPTVLVNGVQQVVAELTSTGFVPATGWAWYIVQPQPNLPSYGLFQFGGDSPLTSGDTLIIEYQTPISPILWLQNDSQIAIRAAIEGNTGVYEDVEQAPSTTDPASIAVYCAGLLARYSNGIPFQVTYQSRNQLGLFSGQVQTIDVSNPPLNFTGLISSVTWQDVDGQFMQLSVTVMSGEYLGTDFTQFFAALVAGTQLAQPANSNTYTWLIAPTVPGVTNPGITTEFYVTPQVNIVNNAVECLLFMVVTMAVAEPNFDDTFNVLLNGVQLKGTDSANVQVNVPFGSTGQFTYYPTPGTVYLYAGNVLTIQRASPVVFPDPLKDCSVQLYTVVLNT
jgi:hypothetical protein